MDRAAHLRERREVQVSQSQSHRVPARPRATAPGSQSTVAQLHLGGLIPGCWDGGSSPKRGQWWGVLLPVRACNWSHSPSHRSAWCSCRSLSQVVRWVPPQLRFLGARQAPAHQQGQEVRVHDGQQR